MLFVSALGGAVLFAHYQGCQRVCANISAAGNHGNPRQACPGLLSVRPRLRVAQCGNAVTAGWLLAGVKGKDIAGTISARQGKCRTAQTVCHAAPHTDAIFRIFLPSTLADGATWTCAPCVLSLRSFVWPRMAPDRKQSQR